MTQLPHHKWAPAFPMRPTWSPNSHELANDMEYGLSQYAYVAAGIHSRMAPTWGNSYHEALAKVAFDHADAFFAELAKRTTPTSP